LNFIALMIQYKGCRLVALTFFGGLRVQTKLLLLLGLLLCLWLSACQEGQVQAPKLWVPQQLLTQPEQQKAGARLFFKHCRECHGTSAEGRNPRAGRFVPAAPDFVSHSWLKVEPAYLYWRIAMGKQIEPFRSRGSVMPAWKPHLTEQQIWQLVAYLRQRAGAD
jgi:mono/diheme cytochrome c family protein